MAKPRLSRNELKIMEALWQRGPLAVRQIQELLPEKNRPAYTTVQTMVTRLEGKKAVRRAGKIGNAHIYEALVSRGAAHRRLVDEILSVFGGRAAPLMSHLIESGHLTMHDIEEARAAIRKHEKKD
jgi:predicted transcriptional regulator